MKNKGVTIIELSVVILVIGLIVFSLSPFVRIAREKIYNTRAVKNLQKMSIALREFAAENNQTLPATLALIHSEGFLSDEKVFDSPFSQHAGSAQDPDYIYMAEDNLYEAENKILIYEKKDSSVNGTVYALYLNGDIERVPITKDGTIAGTMNGAMAE